MEKLHRPPCHHASIQFPTLWLCKCLKYCKYRINYQSLFTQMCSANYICLLKLNPLSGPAKKKKKKKWCPWIFSVTRGSQTLKHIRINWESYLKCKLQSPIPRDSDSVILLWYLAINQVSRSLSLPPSLSPSFSLFLPPPPSSQNNPMYVFR